MSLPESIRKLFVFDPAKLTEVGRTPLDALYRPRFFALRRSVPPGWIALCRGLARLGWNDFQSCISDPEFRWISNVLSSLPIEEVPATLSSDGVLHPGPSTWASLHLKVAVFVAEMGLATGHDGKSWRAPQDSYRRFLEWDSNRCLLIHDREVCSRNLCREVLPAFVQHLINALAGQTDHVEAKSSVGIPLLSKGDAIIGRLHIEVISGGSGRIYPHCNSSLLLTCDQFKQSLQNAIGWLRHRSTVESLNWQGRCDLRWDFRLLSEHTSVYQLEGNSAGLGFALGGYLAVRKRSRPIGGLLVTGAVGRTGDGGFKVESVGGLPAKIDRAMQVKGGLFSTLVLPDGSAEEEEMRSTGFLNRYDLGRAAPCVFEHTDIPVKAILVRSPSEIPDLITDCSDAEHMRLFGNWECDPDDEQPLCAALWETFRRQELLTTPFEDLNHQRMGLDTTFLSLPSMKTIEKEIKGASTEGGEAGFSVIVGVSGCGKSTLLRSWASKASANWRNKAPASLSGNPLFLIKAGHAFTVPREPLTGADDFLSQILFSGTDGDGRADWRIDLASKLQQKHGTITVAIDGLNEYVKKGQSALFRALLEEVHGRGFHVLVTVTPDAWDSLRDSLSGLSVSRHSFTYRRPQDDPAASEPTVAKNAVRGQVHELKGGLIDDIAALREFYFLDSDEITEALKATTHHRATPLDIQMLCRVYTEQHKIGAQSMPRSPSMLAEQFTKAQLASVNDINVDAATQALDFVASLECGLQAWDSIKPSVVEPHAVALRRLIQRSRLLKDVSIGSQCRYRFFHDRYGVIWMANYLTRKIISKPSSETGARLREFETILDALARSAIGDKLFGAVLVVLTQHLASFSGGPVRSGLLGQALVRACGWAGSEKIDGSGRHVISTLIGRTFLTALECGYITVPRLLKDILHPKELIQNLSLPKHLNHPAPARELLRMIVDAYHSFYVYDKDGALLAKIVEAHRLVHRRWSLVPVPHEDIGSLGELAVWFATEFQHKAPHGDSTAEEEATSVRHGIIQVMGCTWNHRARRQSLKNRIQKLLLLGWTPHRILVAQFVLITKVGLIEGFGKIDARQTDLAVLLRETNQLNGYARYGWPPKSKNWKSRDSLRWQLLRVIGLSAWKLAIVSECRENSDYFHIPDKRYRQRQLAEAFPQIVARHEEMMGKRSETPLQTLWLSPSVGPLLRSMVTSAPRSVNAYVGALVAATYGLNDSKSLQWLAGEFDRCCNSDQAWSSNLYALNLILAAAADARLANAVSAQGFQLADLAEILTVERLIKMLSVRYGTPTANGQPSLVLAEGISSVVLREELRWKAHGTLEQLLARLEGPGFAGDSTHLFRQAGRSLRAVCFDADPQLVRRVWERLVRADVPLGEPDVREKEFEARITAALMLRGGALGDGLIESRYLSQQKWERLRDAATAFCDSEKQEMLGQRRLMQTQSLWSRAFTIGLSNPRLRGITLRYLVAGLVESRKPRFIPRRSAFSAWGFVSEFATYCCGLLAANADLYSGKQLPAEEHFDWNEALSATRSCRNGVSRHFDSNWQLRREPRLRGFPIRLTVYRQFDRAYRRWKGGPGKCSLELVADTFDGHEYSVDAFLEKYAPAFEDPASFFTLPALDKDLELTRKGEPRREAAGIQKTSYAFQTQSPPRWSQDGEVPFDWFTRPDRRADTILLVCPGWGRNELGFENDFCAALCERGIDAGLMTVPLHLSRAPTAISGEYWISANVFLTIENFRRQTIEIRSLIRHMRKHYKRVGLIGISSGGFTSALAADCEDVDFFFPIITGAHLAEITWQSAITQEIRQKLQAKGFTRETLGRAWAIIDQLALGRHCKARQVKQFISLADEVVPPRCQFVLSEALSHRPLTQVILPCAHYSMYFMRKRIIREIVRSVYGT